jgi:lysyl-tRNA synthetase class 2
VTERSYPYRYERTHEIADLRKRFDALEPEAEAGETARIAGRIMTVRSHGKVAFADVADASGRLQLFAQQGVLGEEGMATFGQIGVGDIVGAEGDIVMSRRGELSLRVVDTTILAECLRPMPDNWHGLSDVEVRYRHRYLDLLFNPEARRIVEARARANAAIREFFAQRDFLEVETPLLQPIAGGAVARPFVTHHNALDIDLFLRVAPELYLKRLLIGGLERVYELNRSFRNEGVSTRHNPEFTMLEAYEAYVDYDDTMALVEDLLRAIAEAVNGHLLVEAKGASVDLATPFERVTMFEAIERVTGRSLEAAWRAEDREALVDAAKAMGVDVDDRWGPGKILAEIFEGTTEKELLGPVFIAGFPKEVSPLAKDHRSIPGFTEHSDLVIGGVELAPIYSELNDPDEQRRRFQQQSAARAAGDDEAVVPDEEFLEALEYGMPPAGGFGLGVDRLLTLLLGAGSIREIVLFPTLRPS